MTSSLLSPPSWAVARAADAPAATLVIDGRSLPAGWSRRRVLAWALPARNTLLRRASGLGAKTAVVLPANDADLRVEFVQGLPDGSVDLSVRTCVNSAVAAAEVARESWRDPSVGDAITVSMGGAPYGFTRAGPGQWWVTVPLPAPGAADAGMVPALVAGVRASVVRFPLPYVLAEVDAANFFDTVSPESARRFEILRRKSADLAGVGVSEAVPKLGLVANGNPSMLRTRLGATSGWHPGAPGSGLLAFGYERLLRAGVVDDGWVLTPAGARQVVPQPCGDGRPGLRVHTTVRLSRSRRRAA